MYIYGNIVSVDISKGFNADGLGDVVRNMYQYWKPGMEMPDVRRSGAEAAPAAAAGGDSGGGGAVESAYEQLVPQSSRTQRRGPGQVAGQPLARLATTPVVGTGGTTWMNRVEVRSRASR